MPDFELFFGRSPAMREVYRQIEDIARAPVPVSVLITGESGTGKELAARAIHALADPRAPLVVANCAEFTDSLADSQLFGHRRGAFTGAVDAHAGLISEAHGGFLFLDEVGELRPDVQAKLLRTLDSGEYRRLGGARGRVSSFRVLAATNRDLQRLAREGKFRHDLLHRLGSIVLELPPLRDRREDIPLLVDAFLLDLDRRASKPVPDRVSRAAMGHLKRQPWPGNVRELRSVVIAAAVFARGPEIGEAEILKALSHSRSVPRFWSEDRESLPTLAEAEAETRRWLIEAALRLTNGDRRQAAELIRTSLSTVYRGLEPETSERHRDPGARRRGSRRGNDSDPPERVAGNGGPHD